MTPQESKPKNFWNRPEGLTAMLLWGAAGILIIWFWGNVVGFVLSAAIDTLHLILVGSAIALLLGILTSKKAHYIGRSLARLITGWFVAIDPIGIRKTYIEQTQKKKMELDSAVNDIRGLRIKLNGRLQANQGAYQQSMRLLQGAGAILKDSHASDDRKRQANRVVSNESKHSDGLDARITKQTERLTRYDMVVNVLGRYGEVCDDTILNLQREVEMQQEDQEESRGFRRGMKAAFGILRGSGADKEMDDMAVEQLQKDYAAQMGEVEGLLDLTKDIISRADMEDDASITAMQEKLERWSSTNTEMQIGRGGGSKQDLIQASTPTLSSPASEPLKITNKN